MTNIDLDALRALAEKATPQDFDSAEYATNNGWIECPHCGGEGAVEMTADYCNYDGDALGVQFYGIGEAHKNAEAFCRAANPQTILSLIARIRELEDKLPCSPEQAIAAWSSGRAAPEDGKP